MTQVCDFSNQHINLAQVKSNGLVGIISYVSDTVSKNLTQSNFDQALGLGLTVTLVCEQGQQQALRGTAGGLHDASIANAQATALGYPSNAAIYYVAEDPSRVPTSDWPTVVQYFQALSGRPVGAYGGLDLVSHLMELGLATYGWVVQTWGGTNATVQLEQLVGAPTFGLPIDIDNVLHPDYGQMPRPDPPPKESDDEMVTYAESPYDSNRHVVVYDPTSEKVTHYWQKLDGSTPWSSEILPAPA